MRVGELEWLCACMCVRELEVCWRGEHVAYACVSSLPFAYVACTLRALCVAPIALSTLACVHPSASLLQIAEYGLSFFQHLGSVSGALPLLLPFIPRALAAMERHADCVPVISNAVRGLCWLFCVL
jgi:hypothetical protein